jgi:hypothetical protein
MPRIIPVLLLLTAPLLAQPALLIGGGPAVTWLNSVPRDEVQSWPKIGYNFMAQAEFPIGPELSLVVGPSLESKGEKYEFVAPGFNSWDKAKISLTYVQLPLLIKFSSKEPGIVLSGLVGPEFGFLVAQRLEFDGEEDDEFSEWTSPDFGVGWGVQADFPREPNAKGSFFLRFGGYYGLVDGSSGFGNPFWNNNSSRNINVKLTVGLRFGGRIDAPAPKPAPTGAAAPLPPAEPPSPEAPPVRRPIREVLER